MLPGMPPGELVALVVRERPAHDPYPTDRLACLSRPPEGRVPSGVVVLGFGLTPQEAGQALGLRGHRVPRLYLEAPGGALEVPEVRLPGVTIQEHVRPPSGRVRES